MLRRLLSRRPRHGTVAAYLALFIALGGTAYAANTIRSSDIVDGQVFTRDLADSARDKCPVPDTVRLGRVCATVPPLVSKGTFWQAVARCGARGLRLPTYSEAATMGQRYDVPGVGSGTFWTDDQFFAGEPSLRYAFEQNEAGNSAFIRRTDNPDGTAVCVTTPSN
jgi:hypothetical protein